MMCLHVQLFMCFHWFIVWVQIFRGLQVTEYPTYQFVGVWTIETLNFLSKRSEGKQFLSGPYKFISWNSMHVLSIIPFWIFLLGYFFCPLHGHKVTASLWDNDQTMKVLEVDWFISSTLGQIFARLMLQLRVYTNTSKLQNVLS